jgi:hypothetical protein
VAGIWGTWGESSNGEWMIMPLDGHAAVALKGDRQRPALYAGCGSDSPARVVLLRGVQNAADSRWMLLCGAGERVLVNGALPAAGIRMLRDHDEVRIGSGNRIFFTTESLARVEPMPDLGQEVKCARCHDPIAVGSPAVRCPLCGVWHHQAPESKLPCWCYGPRCAAHPQCPQETGLDGDYRWTPDEEG